MRGEFIQKNITDPQFFVNSFGQIAFWLILREDVRMEGTRQSIPLTQRLNENNAGEAVHGLWTSSPASSIKFYG
jgi:hypothetical protein